MKRSFIEIVRIVFVMMNTVVCGLLLLFGGLGLTGRLADAGVWENQGYGVVFLSSAVVACVNLIALFSESCGSRALRSFAYILNVTVWPAGICMLWAGQITTAIGGFALEILVCWGFGIANIMAIVITHRGQGENLG